MAAEKQKSTPRKKKIKHEFLPDAIVEGKFLGQIGTELVISRFRNGRDTLSVCIVKQLEDTGLVHSFDETLQQWFTFSVKEPPKVIKLLK